MKQYRFSFDPWGLLLIGLVMLPNLFWFAVPAPNDVLRGQSVTLALDGIGSGFQILAAAALCAVAHVRRPEAGRSPLFLAAAGCGLLYYVGWGLYYFGLATMPVILLLTVSPCLTLLFFAMGRKNLVAAVFISGFAVCHLLSSIVNFICL